MSAYVCLTEREDPFGRSRKVSRDRRRARAVGWSSDHLSRALDHPLFSNPQAANIIVLALTGCLDLVADFKNSKCPHAQKRPMRSLRRRVRARTSEGLRFWLNFGVKLASGVPGQPFGDAVSLDEVMARISGRTRPGCPISKPVSSVVCGHGDVGQGALRWRETRSRPSTDRRRLRRPTRR